MSLIRIFKIHSTLHIYIFIDEKLKQERNAAPFECDPDYLSSETTDSYECGDEYARESGFPDVLDLSQ